MSILEEMSLPQRLRTPGRTPAPGQCPLKTGQEPPLKTYKALEYPWMIIPFGVALTKMAPETSH